MHEMCRLHYHMLGILLYVIITVCYCEPSTSISIDPNGYLIFCTCMGRFGNQAEHYLGALAFAKDINRTLLLPPWRTYKNVAFSEWFNVSAVESYHRVMLAEDFMATLSEQVWPEDKRVGYCYSHDPHYECKMKDGNPFGPFWDGLGIDFVSTETYSLSYDSVLKEEWSKRYPGSQYPVLALRGAPATFPLRAAHVPLQGYLQWSHTVLHLVREVLEGEMAGEPYVGVHLRNGADWSRACAHIDSDRHRGSHYMASYQCLGHGNERGNVTRRMCLPLEDDILRLTKNVVLASRVRLVYVATDQNAMIPELTAHLSKQKVRVLHHDPHLPQVDLAVLARAKHFIGNCVSSFSAFVYRERLAASTASPTSYFGFTH